MYEETIDPVIERKKQRNKPIPKNVYLEPLFPDIGRKRKKRRLLQSTDGEEILMQDESGNEVLYKKDRNYRNVKCGQGRRKLV